MNYLDSPGWTDSDASCQMRCWILESAPFVIKPRLHMNPYERYNFHIQKPDSYVLLNVCVTYYHKSKTHHSWRSQFHNRVQQSNASLYLTALHLWNGQGSGSKYIILHSLLQVTQYNILWGTHIHAPSQLRGHQTWCSPSTQTFHRLQKGTYRRYLFP